MKPGDGSTFIGKPAKFNGDLSTTDDLQIDGEFEGTIKVTGARLTVGADARVRASITAGDVVIFGRVEGDIYASGRVDLRSSAVVLGDIFAGRLSIEDNAALRGYVDPSRSGESASAKPAAVTSRPGLATASSMLGGSRSPELVAAPTPVPQGRQMPSALAAIAAAGRSDALAAETEHSEHADSGHDDDTGAFA